MVLNLAYKTCKNSCTCVFSLDCLSYLFSCHISTKVCAVSTEVTGIRYNELSSVDSLRNTFCYRNTTVYISCQVFYERVSLPFSVMYRS